MPENHPYVIYYYFYFCLCVTAIVLVVCSYDVRLKWSFVVFFSFTSNHNLWIFINFLRTYKTADFYRTPYNLCSAEYVHDWEAFWIKKYIFYLFFFYLYTRAKDFLLKTADKEIEWTTTRFYHSFCREGSLVCKTGFLEPLLWSSRIHYFHLEYFKKFCCRYLTSIIMIVWILTEKRLFFKKHRTKMYLVLQLRKTTKELI